MLTTEAFNALLKTLEEPPAHVVFILATTEPHKIPATIHSRCQRYDFRRIGVEDIVGRLEIVAKANSFDISPDALRIIAVHADGGLRDALSILDQCTTLANGKITADDVRNLLGLIGYEWIWQLTEAMAKRETVTSLKLLDEIIAMGKDVRQVLLETCEHLRNVMLYKAAPHADFMHIVKAADEAVLKEQALLFSHAEIVHIIESLNKAANDVKWTDEPRIVAEMTLISICQRALPDDMASLIKRVEQLEQKIAGGAAVVKSPPMQAAMTQPEFTTEKKVQPQQTAVTPKQKVKEVKQNIQPGPVAEQDLETVWQKVLQQLVTEGKRSVHACVAQGRLVSLKENSAEIQFSGRFPKERTEKDDYRSIVETVLAGLCGRIINIHCRLELETPAITQTGSNVSSEKVMREHSVLRQAENMFGGKILEQHEEE